MAEAAKTNAISFGDYKTQIANIEKKYSQDVNRLLKETIGIESTGFPGAVKGTFQRYQTLGPYTQTNIVFTGAATIATTLGAYFLINKNMKLHHELKSIHEKIDQPDGVSR